MNQMMINGQSKRIQFTLKRTISWKIVAVLLLIHFALFENLFADYIFLKPLEEWDFLSYFMHQLSDRFVLLLGNGLGLVYVFHKIFITQENAYIKIRIGSDRKMDFLSEMVICTISFLFLIVQIGLVIAIGIVGGTLTWISGSDLLFILKMCINMLGYYITLGNAVFILQKVCKKRVLVYLCSVAILLLNFGISNGTNFMSGWMGKMSWIGNTMVMNANEYSCNIIYWLFWNIVSLFLIRCMRSVSKDAIWKRISANVQRIAVFVCGTSIVFGVFGVISKDNLFIVHSTAETLLQDYFVGFDRIGVHLFLYLFYQLPVWMFVYQYLTRNFAVYGIQYILRIGSIKQWFRRLVSKMMVYVTLYYLIGAMILFLLNPTCIMNLDITILYEDIVVVINLILQTIVFVLISFWLWMMEESGKNIGFTGVLMVHLLSVAVGAKHVEVAKWCPWTQGIYWLNSNHQLFSVIYQMVWIVVVVFVIMHYLKWRQNDVLTRKMKRI